jgi:epoxyqueuosine reductase
MLNRNEIEQAIADFLRDSPRNYVEELGGLRIFDAPLVGVASSEDPLFDRLKEQDAVGPQHKSPGEWLTDAKAVISYFLPFDLAVRKANRQEGLPAKEWLYGRIEGEALNNALRQFLVDYFSQAGYQAVSPVLDPRFTVVQRRSNWSERHVGFIAGLGTFSLNRSFITTRGSAGRLGSVVVNLDLEATPRSYVLIDENCSHCGACIPRCPPQAIVKSGKDNAICGAYLDKVRDRYRPRYGCGKCQTGVPCEDRIPGR